MGLLIRRRVVGLHRGAVLVGLLCLLAVCAGCATSSDEAQARERTTFSTSTQPAISHAELSPLAQKLTALALHEHQMMGGALIDVRGGLVREGWAEAERAHLPDSDVPAWRRVWRYWRAVPDFYNRHLAWMQWAAPQAVQRVAMVDQPWSAAFISWLLRSAGASNEQFVFSAAHHDYVRQAFKSTEAERVGRHTSSLYRARDVRKHAAHVGDLMCFARGADDGLSSFEQLQLALAEGPVRMHCDMVVGRDAHKLQLIGGNVVQSVTMRELALAEDGSGLLSTSYLESTKNRRRMHLNQRPWSVLLALQ